MGEDLNIRTDAAIAEEEPENTKKQIAARIAKVVLFLGIFCVIIYLLCDIFEYHNNYLSQRYKLYKEFEPDMIDAVIIGTSGVDRSWIAAKGYDKFGLAVYPLSIDAMPCWTALDMIKEAYRFQDPKLIILDMRMFVVDDPSNNLDLSKTRARRVIDTLNFFSPNRLDAINRTLKIINDADPEEEEHSYDLSFFLTFIQYHSAWADEDFEFLSEIGSKPSKYLGFYLTRNSIVEKKLKKTKWTKKRMDLTPIAEESLYEVLDYCRDNGIDLLFIDSPHYLDEDEVKKTNRLCDILDSRDIKWVRYSGSEWYNNEKGFDDQITLTDDGMYVVTFNGVTWEFENKELAEEYLTKHTFNRKLHFYDSAHLNFEGAAIFTRLLGDYLVTNYDLGNHTDDPRYEDWVKVYSKIKRKIKTYRAESDPGSEDIVLTEEDLKELKEEQKEIKDEEQLMKEEQKAVEDDEEDE